jgi:hypothetical protein
VKEQTGTVVQNGGTPLTALVQTGVEAPAAQAEFALGWDEIVGAGAILGGSALILASDAFGAHERWARIGGVVLTAAGMIPAFMLIREYRAQRKAAGR